MSTYAVKAAPRAPRQEQRRFPSLRRLLPRYAGRAAGDLTLAATPYSRSFIPQPQAAPARLKQAAWVVVGVAVAVTISGAIVALRFWAFV